MGKNKINTAISAEKKLLSSSPSPSALQEQNSLSKLDEMLCVGADFDAPTQDLWRTLLGREAAVSDVANCIRNGADANARNQYGLSMLFLAIRQEVDNSFPMTRLIFEAGASLVDDKGKTPEINYAKKLLDGGCCHRLLLGLDSVRKEQAALDKATAKSAISKPSPRM